jgi:hypothetical protein
LPINDCNTIYLEKKEVCCPLGINKETRRENQGFKNLPPERLTNGTRKSKLESGKIANQQVSKQLTELAEWA